MVLQGNDIIADLDKSRTIICGCVGRGRSSSHFLIGKSGTSTVHENFPQICILESLLLLYSIFEKVLLPSDTIQSPSVDDLSEHRPFRGASMCQSCPDV